MKSLVFARQRLTLLILVLSLSLFVAGCSSEPEATDAPEDAQTTSEETSSDTSSSQSAAETEEAEELPEQPDVFADTLPCDATVIDSSESRLNIRYREPTDDESLNIGAIRPNTPVSLDEMQERDGIIWYEAVLNNISQGWIQARWFELGDDCVTADASADTEETSTEEETTDTEETSTEEETTDAEETSTEEETTDTEETSTEEEATEEASSD